MLRRKMFRELMENKGTYIACISIIVIGLMVFASFSIVMDNLQNAKNTFYHNQNFADGFAEVKAMPYQELEKLQDLEGIDNIQGRLIKEVRVLRTDSKESIYLRLISIDPHNNVPINGVLLEKGTPLDNGKMNIWVDSKFFAANDIELNDTIDIIAAGKKRNLRIVGCGNNPEFIYAMRNSGDLFPNPKTFGIAYIPFETMKTLFKEKASFNNIIFTLKPGTDYNDVEDLLKTELKPYGLTNIYPRKDQSSHVLLTQELDQLKSMSKVLPVIFLSVACMILYIMLKRTIENQRGQIGILKAFGYTKKEILFHYLSLALVMGIIGGIIGGIFGILLSFQFTAIYKTFFNIPGLSNNISLTYFFLSIILSLLFSLIAGYQGCKGILTLEPAEAMRPPAPPIGKSILLEKISFFWNALTVQGKMALRSMSRHPGRTIFMFLGIMFTFALLGFPWTMLDMSQQMLFDQYEKVEVYDLKLTLARPLDQEQIERELKRFPGIKKVESRAEIPVKLKNKWLEKDVVVLGLKTNSELHKIMDKNYRQVELPPNGILLSERLAGLLNAKIGTPVSLEFLTLKNSENDKTVEVSGIIPQYMGLNAYMEINSLQKLLGQGNIASSIMVNIDEKYQPLLEEKYRSSELIGGIEDKNELLEQSQELMASYSGTIYIYLIIGLIIGFAIIYNSSVITVSERKRELASMMVLGMSPKEVLSVITFEQWFISIFAMLAGIPLTKMFLVGMAESINNDVYTMPTTFGMKAVIASFLITITCIWIAQRFAAKKINGLSIVEVLKAKE